MDKPTRYYINGVELRYAPKGWETDYLKYLRSDRYYGMFYDAALDLEFVKDGAAALREVYYSEGSEGVATFSVKRLNKRTLLYEDIVTDALFDFTTFDDNFTFVKCQVKFSGIDADFKNNDEKKYTIDVPSNRILFFDGVSLKNANSEHTTYNDGDLNVLLDPSGLPSNNYGRTALSTDVSSEVDPFDRILTQYTYASTYFIGQNSWFLQAKSRMEVTVNASFSMLRWRLLHPSGDAINEVVTVRADLVVTSSGYAPKQTINIWNISHNMTGIGGIAQINYGDISNTVTAMIDEGDKLHVVLSMTLPNATTFLNKYAIWEASSLLIDVKSQLPQAEIRCIEAFELFEELVAKMAPTATPVSTFLSTLPTDSKILLTSGSSIRSDASPTMQLSFKQFFESINAIYPIGVGIEGNNIVLEQRQYFYDDSATIDLGVVSELKVTNAKMLHNVILAGCETQEYEQDNGRDEFNARQEWETPLKKSDSQYNIISPLRTDMYGIDTLRVQFAATTKDNKDDNAVFIIDATRLPGVALNQYYVVSRYKFSDISGLTDTFSAFNLLFSPKRCIIRHGAELRSIMAFNQTSYINLLNHDKNVELRNTLGGVEHVEATSILISDLARHYFNPIMFSFEIGQNIAIFATMKNNNNKLFKFTWSGNEFTGWLQDVSVFTAERGKLNVMLLCSASNDLTLLQ